jgi:hypothetical protein
MALRANDLRNLVKNVFEIDAYRSKLGDDQDIVVVSFTVTYEGPAKDLENFVEMGYNFVLDADVSPGETDDGTYKVFVELERDRHAPEYIFELLDGIERLTGIPDMRFRYFKSFSSQDATLENLQNTVPTDIESYNYATDKSNEDNYATFFSNSNANSIDMVNESIVFKRRFANPVRFKIVDFGNKTDIYKNIKGSIMCESSDFSEIMFYSKFIGEYNITKIGDKFIFDNRKNAVVMERE